MLKNAKPLRSNLSINELRVLRNPKNNDSIVFLKFDKAGATVVMKKVYYITKMNDHLTTSGSYRKLGSNPISKIIKEVKKSINETNLDERTKKRLTPSYQITPRIYGLPKIYKEGTPLRWIVITMGSPTYELAKFVAKILAPLVGKTDSYIKDSSDFVKLLK